MPKYYIIEGSIGAGKTTLLEQLKRILERQLHYSVCIIPEPVDVWLTTGALESFYKDKSRAYEFQTFVYSTRVMRIKEYVEKFPNTDVFLIERSVISDRYLFASLLQDGGQFSDLQKIMYENWVAMWNHLLPFKSPSGFIYLAPSLEETLRRIEIRNRTGEIVSREYQEKLYQKHEELFGQLYKKTTQDEDKNNLLDICTTLICNGIATPVLRIYNDDDYRYNDNHKIFQDICAFITNN